jgi:hypothetical protein
MEFIPEPVCLIHEIVELLKDYDEDDYHSYETARTIIIFMNSIMKTSLRSATRRTTFEKENARMTDTYLPQAGPTSDGGSPSG